MAGGITMEFVMHLTLRGSGSSFLARQVSTLLSERKAEVGNLSGFMMNRQFIGMSRGNQGLYNDQTRIDSDYDFGPVSIKVHDS